MIDNVKEVSYELWIVKNGELFDLHYAESKYSAVVEMADAVRNHDTFKKIYPEKEGFSFVVFKKICEYRVAYDKGIHWPA